VEHGEHRAPDHVPDDGNPLRREATCLDPTLHVAQHALAQRAPEVVVGRQSHLHDEAGKDRIVVHDAE
jgi:hypothetical protein